MIGKIICVLTVPAVISGACLAWATAEAPPRDWAIEIRVEPQFPEGVSAPVIPRLVPDLPQAHIGLYPASNPQVFRVAPLVPGIAVPPDYLTVVFESGMFPPFRDNIFGFDFKVEDNFLIARVTSRPEFKSGALPYIVGFQQSMAGDDAALTLDFGLNNPTSESISIVGLDLKGQEYRGACYTIYSKIKLGLDIKGEVVSGVGDVENGNFKRRKKLKGYMTNCGSLNVGLESRLEVPAKRQMDVELGFDRSDADLIQDYEWWKLTVTLDVRGKLITLSESINTERIRKLIEGAEPNAPPDGQRTGVRRPPVSF